MNELDEWRRHLGLPVEIELENPYGEKFKVKMKSTEGEDKLTLLGMVKEFTNDDEKNKEFFTRENIRTLVRIMSNSITNIPEEVKEEIIGRYFFEIFPQLFNLNFTSKASDTKDVLNKQILARQRMDELRKNDEKSPENNKS